MSTVLAAALVGLGLALMVLAIVLRAREREAELAKILELPYGEQDAHVGEQPDRIAFLEPGVALAQRALERANLVQRVTEELLRARLPLRPGEFVLIALGNGIVGGIAAWLLTGQALVGAMLGVAFVAGSWFFVLWRSSKRTSAFEAQLPEALSLIASSLEAGHTFLRAIEMMVEESAPPLNEEFERVLSETRLGDPLIEALQRMSDRLQVKDFAWVVQAIRIQQQVGGRLAELLFTLAEFMRAREEIRREVRVLTAEGRMSANVLGALPFGVFLLLKTGNPEYIDPLLHRDGGGIFFLIYAVVSVAIGITIIRRMAKVDV
ncbi:MAG TPA: type II secretion system F family protein [Actinomycetota bacterium]